MRKYIYIILGLLLLSLGACIEKDLVPGQEHNSYNKVVLTIEALKVATRSADTDPEATLAWVDVYIMNEDSTIYHRERIDKSSAPVVGGGEFILKKGRDKFPVNSKYYVYVVANSSAPLNEEVANWNGLRKLVQTDRDLHLSGFNIAIMPHVPKYFLMDGYTYVGDSDPEEMRAYVINDGVKSNKIELNGTLHRAAAKIILNITQGKNVEFKKEMDGDFPLYSIYQLPISTLLIAPEATSTYKSVKQTTVEHGMDGEDSTKPFYWSIVDGKPKITFIAYAYANDWSGKKIENETSLLLSIPLLWDKENDGTIDTKSSVNWYKIPLSRESRFERNKCYIINININTIGAEDKSTPIELKDIEYVALDWEDVQVGLGDNEARYLTLNTDLVKIYDKNFDLDQLTFTSSSPIKSIKLKDVFRHDEANGHFTNVEKTESGVGDNYVETYGEGDGVYAYYIDKFGQKVQLGTDPGFDIAVVERPELTKEQILALENNLYQKEGVDIQYIHCEVPAEQKRALNGNIHIYSPINAVADNEDLNWPSHFNTVRYLEFEVMNEQGLTATFRVEQRPTIIITNEEGYFSYRSDQKYSDDQKEASHFHNYMGWKSLHLSGLMWAHIYDWTDVPYDDDEESICLDESIERNYNKAVKVNKDWPECEVIHYGDIGVPHEFIDSRNQVVTYTYGGLYRSAIHPSESFLRHRYYMFPSGQTDGVYKEQKQGGNIIGGYRYNSRNYFHNRGDVQGLAIGPIYEVEVDGEIRKYRKQYPWNVQPIFYNLYVGKVWKNNGTDSNGRAKLKGQADIHSMTHAQTTYIYETASGWKPWGLQSYTNHRMYNIITSNTNENYTIGYPSILEDGVPNNVPDNAKLVSPGLMIASQLGETRYQSIINAIEAGNATSPGSYPYKVPVVGQFYKLAQEHCREYVETTFKDKPDANGVYNGVWDEGEEVIHYDDWRLPTKTEIDRIIEFQGSSRAMDKLLVGQYYFCITGNGEDADINDQANWVSREVPNYSNTMSGYYIRCVRDAGRKK